MPAVGLPCVACWHGLPSVCVGVHSVAACLADLAVQQSRVASIAVAQPPRCSQQFPWPCRRVSGVGGALPGHVLPRAPGTGMEPVAHMLLALLLLSLFGPQVWLSACTRQPPSARHGPATHHVL